MLMKRSHDEARVTVALPKGRLFEPAVNFLTSIDWADAKVKQMDRVLLLDDTARSVRYLLVRPSDVITYVSEGAADFGIVGKDVILEEARPVYEVIDLGFGACYLAVAAPAGRFEAFDNPEDFYRSQLPELRVATKYPKIAAEHFARRGIPIHSIALKGNVELAPLVDLADVIVDLVSTGGTLRANDLVELETIAQISARLVVNSVSLRVKPRIGSLLRALHGRFDGKELGLEC